MKDLNQISRAVRNNCIVNKRRRDTNYSGHKWDDPYLPMALMMYFMQKYDYPIQEIFLLIDFQLLTDRFH